MSVKKVIIHPYVTKMVASSKIATILYMFIEGFLLMAGRHLP